MQSHSANGCRITGFFYIFIFDTYKGPFSKGSDYLFIKGDQNLWTDSSSEGKWMKGGDFIDMIQVMPLFANPRVFFSFVY